MIIEFLDSQTKHMRAFHGDVFGQMCLNFFPSDIGLTIDINTYNYACLSEQLSQIKQKSQALYSLHGELFLKLFAAIQNDGECKNRRHLKSV